MEDVGGGQEEQVAAPSQETTLSSWERPWSLEEMRYATDEWTLASDSGLLHHLRQFSANLVTRTKQVDADLDQLVLSAKTLDGAVRNTFNQFIMLSHKQFVENRVYDEDDTPVEGEEAEQPKEEAELNYNQLEALLVPKYQSAIALGLNVLAGRASVRDEFDFESEETKNTDEYSKYPLPFVIGTRQFKEEEYAGLFLPSDHEDDSDLDLEEDFDKEVADVEALQDSDMEDFAEFEEEEDKYEPASDPDGSDLSEDYPDYSDGEDGAEYGDASAVPLPSDDGEEEEGEDSELSQDKLRKTIKEQGGFKLFPDANDVVANSRKSAPSDEPSGWDDEDDEPLFGQASHVGGPSSTLSLDKAPADAPSSGGGGGLFADDDEELFGSAASSKKAPAHDPEEGDLFGSSPSAGRSFPDAGSESDGDVPGDLPPPPSESLEDPLSEESQEAAKKPKFGTQVLPASVLAGALKKKAPASGASLFDQPLGEEEEDEPLFGGASSSTAKSSASPGASTVSEASSSLFGSSSSADTGKKTSEAPKGASLFDDDDDFFSLAKEPAKPSKAAATPAAPSAQASSLLEEPTPSSSASTPAPASTKAAPSSKSKSTTSRASSSLFDDEDEDDPLFGFSSKKATPAASKASKARGSASSKSGGLSLFGDEEDLFGDLSSSSSAPASKASAPAPTPAPKATAVEDDFLFGEDEPPKATPAPAPAPASDDLDLDLPVALDLPTSSSGKSAPSSVEDDFFGSPPPAQPLTSAPPASAKPQATPSSSSTLDDFLSDVRPPSRPPAGDLLDDLDLPGVSGSVEASSLDLPGVAPDALLSPRQEKPPPSPTPTRAAPAATTSAKAGSKISQLQANLQLDPNRMLPGAAGGSKKRELRDPDALTFDTEEERDGPPPKLEHKTKDRPMMAGKRAPSRRRPSRRPASSRSTLASTPSDAKPSAPAPSPSTRQDEEKRRQEEERQRKAKEEEQKKKQEDEARQKREQAEKERKQQEEAQKKKQEEQKKQEQAEKAAEKERKQQEEAQKKKQEQEKAAKAQEASPSLKKRSDDAPKRVDSFDFLSSAPVPSSPAQSTPKRTSVTASNFNFDDLFDDAPTSSPAKKASATPSKATSGASTPKAAASTASKGKASEALPDGIFDDPAVKKKTVKKVVPKKKVASTTSATSTPKAATSTASKSKAKASDFDDIFDDIF